MKIKEGYMLRQFGDDYIVVAVGDNSEDFNKLITLNSVGAFIYKTLKNSATRDEIVSAVLDEYEIDRETAERDTDIFIEKLKAAGLVDE